MHKVKGKMISKNISRYEGEKKNNDENMIFQRNPLKLLKNCIFICGWIHTWLLW